MAVQISGNDITVPRDGSFTRNVTIGGTLTYEDVTNIDSVGLITARNGIEIGARPGVAASISVDGNMIVSGISTFGDNIHAQGKIGINTDDPTARLEIIDSKVRTWSPSSQTELLVERNGNCLLSIVGSDSSNCQLAFGDNDDENIGFIDYDHADNSMAFRTNASERFRITSTGRIEQNNNNEDIDMDSSANGQLKLDGNGYNAAFALNATGLNIYTNSGSRGIVFGINETEVARINNDGNVGINEASPSEALQIDGDILLGGQANSGTANYALKFEYNNHQFAKIVGNGRDSSGYGDIDFYTSSGSGVSNLNQRMTIREDGKVGINVADPDQRLEVDGIIKGSSYIQTGASATNTNNFHFGAQGDGTFRFYHKNYGAGDEIIRFDGSGNLMLSQTTALAKLTVAATWSQAPISCDLTSSNVSGAQINFRFNNSAVGNIVSTSSNTAYNTTSSDRALKKNFEDWNENTLDLFKSLKPQKFHFLNDEDSDPKSKGYIAQDLVDSFPEAYPLNPQTDKYDFNPSGMVTYLMKALQEEIVKREALEARISTLEGS